MAESFSKRMGHKKAPDKLVYGEALESVRKGLIWVIARICREAAPKLSFYIEFGANRDEFLLASVAKWVDGEYRQFLNWEGLCNLIGTCPWYEYYDICEHVYKAFLNLAQTDADTYLQFFPIDFEDEMNRLFQDHGIGYRMNAGRVEYYESAVTHKIVQEARVLLREQGFVGPDEQFEKAIAFLSQRPEPDKENCVKEATGALEGAARIVSGDKTATFGDILNKRFRERIPGGLFKAFEGVWGYASNAPGARHAQVGDKQVTEAEAKLVLGMCAAMILYIAKFAREA